jgi:Response regulator containing a CheY-like receiver domain and an HTH DNA-binding domain
MNKQDVSEPSVLIEEIEGVLRGRVKQMQEDDSAKLTASQIDALRMISEGMTNQQIADKKKQSLRAVEQLLTRTYQAIGITRESGQSMRVVAAQYYKQHLRVNL